jgi:hypothetical protein
MFQMSSGIVPNLAMSADLPGRHLGVAAYLCPRKRLLHLPGFQNALSNFRRTLARHLTR